MSLSLPPPPTYAQVLLTDPSSGQAIFNPIWLDWFVRLAAQVSTLVGGATGAVTFPSYTDYSLIAQPNTPASGFTRVSRVSFNGGEALLLQSVDAAYNYLAMDSFAATSAVIVRAAQGTGAAPTATQINDGLGAFGGQGYGTTAYVNAYTAVMEFHAAENFTDAAGGSLILFRTTLNGTIIPVENLRIWDTGTVSIGGPPGSESHRVVAVAGSTRYVTTAGSVAGNPTIGVSGGKLAVSAAMVLSQAQLLETSVALTNNAAANVGTLNNAPAAGDPTKWIPINDNGTVRNIPAW